MQKLLELQSISEEEAEFLKHAVRAGYSILIAGGTGSGKTTFLNALSEYIPEDERVVVIEDTSELQIRTVPNLVRLETRSAGLEDCREITIRDLIRASLRMRPSRIIVGEVRGGEAFELLTCLNTGHDGVSVPAMQTARGIRSHVSKPWFSWGWNCRYRAIPEADCIRN